MGKKLKRGCALALAVLLGLSCLIQIRTLAAGGIETNREDCTLTISTADIYISSTEDSSYRDDLNEMEIPVSLYRVAEVDATGKYTSLDPFPPIDFKVLDSETKAAEWLTLAEEVEKYLDQATAVREGTIKKAEDSNAASALFEELKTGLYLVVPEETPNTDYTAQYQFTPYLTALPWSNYTVDGQGSDDWIYDAEIGLKAERVPLYGRLNITKSLLNYNETLGPATFVFEIKGQEGDKVVYSNVISITHEGPDSKTVTLGNLPAGLEVTVTEVYSGASYELVPGSAESQTVTIASDEAVTAGIAPEASVSFTNQYDGGNRGGYGATNHFDSDGEGGWTWVNPLPSSPTE